MQGNYAEGEFRLVQHMHQCHANYPGTLPHSVEVNYEVIVTLCFIDNYKEHKQISNI